eukprot:357792-Chlamydomonas_euryale.AAC.3
MPWCDSAGAQAVNATPVLNICAMERPPSICSRLSRKFTSYIDKHWLVFSQPRMTTVQVSTRNRLPHGQEACTVGRYSFYPVSSCPEYSPGHNDSRTKTESGKERANEFVKCHFRCGPDMAQSLYASEQAVTACKLQTVASCRFSCYRALAVTLRLGQVLAAQPDKLACLVPVAIAQHA